ncbi:hypothetical protein OsI_34252 [Oryza sativa Indica Group]|uniref:FAD linked oxidase N-terminal domain-containing protein n=1 Tax=Oryza sativa subsp. indica TaxID=39946 RepID=B8BHS3_ORYSI|nr:hypothetical protein OsI_34252 [Oryza sativa Indica Group]
MSPEQEDWEINGIDRSGLDAQVAEGKLLACCICCVLCSAYSANLVQIATPRTPRPALVLTPVTADEVRAYVVCCRDHGLTVRTRSGGHDYEGLSYRSLRSSGDGEGAARFAVVDVAALWASIACDCLSNPLSWRRHSCDPLQARQSRTQSASIGNRDLALVAVIVDMGQGEGRWGKKYELRQLTTPSVF